jgi:hypothetical protein
VAESQAASQEQKTTQAAMENNPILPVHLIVSTKALSCSEWKCLSLLEDAAPLKFEFEDHSRPELGNRNLIGFLSHVVERLHHQGSRQLNCLADAYLEVVQRCISHTDFGGYGLDQDTELSSDQEAEVLFLCSAYLEAVKSAARTQLGPVVQAFRPQGRRGMTMTEKILAMHDVSRRGFVRPGDIIQVDVDWVIASELSWKVCHSPSLPSKILVLTEQY